MYMYIILIMQLYSRAWKKHLKTAAKDNQLTMYQTLCLLETEVDKTQFYSQMSQFIAYWEHKETQFINYFQEHYQERAGTYSCKTMHNHMYTEAFFTEKAGFFNILSGTSW